MAKRNAGLNCRKCGKPKGRTRPLSLLCSDCDHQGTGRKSKPEITYFEWAALMIARSVSVDVEPGCKAHVISDGMVSALRNGLKGRGIVWDMSIDRLRRLTVKG